MNTGPLHGLDPALTHIDIASARAFAHTALHRHHPGARFGLGALKTSNADRRAHVFCAATPDARLVVKVYAPQSADKGRAQFIRQQQVASALPKGAPDVLFYEEDLRVLGMCYVDGPSLADIWHALAPPERMARLELAGQWLAAFHSLSLRPHPFRPRGPLDWLHAIIQRHHAGHCDIPEFSAFERHVTALEGQFSTVRGMPSQRAILHRDLHLSNLVQTPGGLVGLDFENEKPDEPLRDLVWLLVDTMARSDPEQPAYIAASALARGYGPMLTHPNAMVFIQKLVGLGIWANTDARASQHNVARFVAARQITELGAPLFQA